MNGIWDKIKNSKIVKVATAYGVVCWILLQVQDAVLPTIGAPIWAAQIILFIILIGFPIAVLIAWASEINTKPNINDEDKFTITKNKNNNIYIIGILCTVVIALFAFYASPFIFDYEPKRNYTTKPVENEYIYNTSTVSTKFDLNLGKSSPNEWGLLTEKIQVGASIALDQATRQGISIDLAHVDKLRQQLGHQIPSQLQ